MDILSIDGEFNLLGLYIPQCFLDLLIFNARGNNEKYLCMSCFNTIIGVLYVW